MFSSKSAEWKESPDTLARYVKKSTLSKGLKRKIDLDVRKDKILIFKDSPDPETISTNDYKDVNLGSKKFQNGWNSLLFWTTDKLNIKLEIKYDTPVGEVNLNGIVDLQIMIDTGRYDWEVGKKLIDEFFSDNYNKEFLDKKSIKKLLQEILKNNKKEFLSGLNSNNKNDEDFLLELEKKTKNKISSLIKEQGLAIASLSLLWKHTSIEKLEQEDARTAAILKSGRSKSKRNLTKDLVESDAFKKDNKKTVVKMHKIGRDEEITRFKKSENAKTKLQEVEDENMIKAESSKGRIIDKETELKEKKLVSKIDIIEAKKNLKIKKDEFAVIKQIAVDLDLDPSNPEIMSSIGGWILEGSLPSKYKRTLEKIKQKNYDASWLDQQARIYNDKANDMDEKLDKERPYFFAMEAIMYLARGNAKTIEKMNIAIDECKKLDPDNEIAIMCEIDYLWNKHKQQFFVGMLKIAHMRKQVVKIEELIPKLIDSKRITKEAKEEWLGKHKYVLEVLIKEEELSQKYQDKYQELYG